MSYYHWTRRQVANARWRCIDCGVNVIKAGDFCMLNSKIWETRLHLKWRDNMCITCVEARIGRKLTLTDFCGLPSVAGYPTSAVLFDRIILGDASARGKAKPRKRAKKSLRR